MQASRWLPIRVIGSSIKFDRVGTCLVLLALAIQAFVVQIHVHFAEDPALAVLASGRDTAASFNSLFSLPTGGDVDQCPICQAQVGGGRLDAIQPAVLALPTAAVASAIAIEALSIAFAVLSHSWQGRAPPRL